MQLNNFTPERLDITRDMIADLVRAGKSTSEIETALSDWGATSAEITKIISDLPSYSNTGHVTDNPVE